MGSLPSKKHKKHGNPLSKLILILIPVVIIIIIIGAAFLTKYLPSNEKADLYAYFGLTESGDASGSSDGIAVVIDSQILPAQALLANNTLYLDYDTVHDYLNDRFYRDNNENLTIYAGADSVTKVYDGESAYYEGTALNEEGYIIVKYLDKTAYVALDFVEKYTNMDYSMYEDPFRVVISAATGEQICVNARDGAKIRVKGGIKSPILETCEADQKLVVLERLENWTKVLAEDGIIGYVKNDKLSDEYTDTITHSFTEPVYSHITRDHKINMVWDLITAEAANADISTTLSNNTAINAICPTWFSLSSSDGDITSLADRDYVNSARSAGVEVWGLVGNLEVEDSVTISVLSHTSTREHLESAILASAIEYGLDGVNIDFEISDATVGDSYIEFIRELAILCGNNNLLLSVDVPIALSNNDFYSYDELSKVCDYVIIMAYDEHYEGSGAGSVSSIPWVKSGIEYTLNAGVDADRFLLAVPFYTRVWFIDTEGNGTSTSSEVISISAQSDILSSHDATATYDEDTGQNYAEYTSDGTLRQVWLEDATSMGARMQLVSSYGLGGVAGWRSGLETQEIRDVISSNL